MGLKKFRLKVSRGFDIVTAPLHWLAYVALTLIILLTFVNVMMRFLFNSPVLGDVEIIELTMVVMGAFAMFYTATQRAHINADVFVSRLGPRVQDILERVSFLIGAGIYGIIAYRSAVYATTFIPSPNRPVEMTALLHIPEFPFRFILALGFFLFCLTLLILALRPKQSKGKTLEDLESQI